MTVEGKTPVTSSSPISLTYEVRVFVFDRSINFTPQVDQACMFVRPIFFQVFFFANGRKADDHDVCVI